MGLICPYYSYDDNGALTNTVYSDGTPTISLAYNRAGRQIEAHDAAGVTTFLYDEFGSLTNETVIGVAGTNTIERFYDIFGRSLGYSLNGIRQSTLAYDPATGRLATMLASGSDTPFDWEYLPGSDLKASLAYPNGLTASWQYDANGQLLQVKNAFPTNMISHTGTHTHLYVVNQSPIVRGCKCFWHPVTSIDGDVPPRGAVPMNGRPAGGGVTFK